VKIEGLFVFPSLFNFFRTNNIETFFLVRIHKVSGRIYRNLNARVLQLGLNPVNPEKSWQSCLEVSCFDLDTIHKISGRVYGNLNARVFRFGLNTVNPEKNPGNPVSEHVWKFLFSTSPAVHGWGKRSQNELARFTGLGFRL
jgi:hypothetical protein